MLKSTWNASVYTYFWYHTRLGYIPVIKSQLAISFFDFPMGSNMCDLLRLAPHSAKPECDWDDFGGTDPLLGERKNLSVSYPRDVRDKHTYISCELLSCTVLTVKLPPLIDTLRACWNISKRNDRQYWEEVLENAIGRTKRGAIWQGWIMVQWCIGVHFLLIG